MRGQTIKQGYKWYCEGCEKRKVSPISYKKYAQEFKKGGKLKEIKQEKERLKNMANQLKKAMELLQ